MKLLLDSSSSLLFSLLLAQLPVFTSAFPAPHRRPTDMDKLSNQTKNLMKLTQELLREHAFDSEVEPHRFRSLPEMSNRSANDLNSLELKPTLSQLHADLKLYEHHFEWLNKVSKKHHHPAVPKLVEMIREMKSLINLLHRQMLRVEAPRLTPAIPSLPPTSPISSMCCSPATSSSNTSSSSVIGHTGRSSASSPKRLQSNDDPRTTWLQGHEDPWSPASAKRGIRTMSVCTAVNSVPQEAKTSTSDMSVEECVFLPEPMRMRYTAAIYDHRDSPVKVNSRFNYDDHFTIPQTFS